MKAVCVMRGEEGVKGVVHFSQVVSILVYFYIHGSIGFDVPIARVFGGVLRPSLLYYWLHFCAFSFEWLSIIPFAPALVLIANSPLSRGLHWNVDHFRYLIQNVVYNSLIASFDVIFRATVSKYTLNLRG